MTFEIDEKILEKAVFDAIVDNIAQSVLNELTEGKQFNHWRNPTLKEIVSGVKYALRDLLDKESANIRKDLREDLIERAIDKMNLDKKEIIKSLLK